MSTQLLIRQVTLAEDPGVQRDVLLDLDEGRIRIGADVAPGKDPDRQEVDGTGLILLPGLFDLHAHLREPGREDCETIATGTEAAIRGGITGLVMMPDTTPPVDNGGIVQSLRETAGRQARIEVLVAGTISRGRAGEELAGIGEMQSRGAVMITDDPAPVDNPLLLLRALQYARDSGLILASHCDVPQLSGSGAMHEGAWSYRLGLPGIPPCAEEIAIARDLRLAQSCRGSIHIKHVTTRQGVETIRRYRNAGVQVTSEVTPHHLLFQADHVGDYDTVFKVRPPLRTEDDRQALLEGLKDGVIDAIATDHSPCSGSEKSCDFASAAFGMTGLETALASLHQELIHPGRLDWPVLVERFSHAPRRVVGLHPVRIEDGGPVNCVLFDPKGVSRIDADSILSRSRNTPWFGKELRGAVVLVALGHRILHSRLSAASSGPGSGASPDQARQCEARESRAAISPL